MIIENEDLPPISIVIEKNNRKKYKMKSCEYIINLKNDFFWIFCLIKNGAFVLDIWKEKTQNGRDGDAIV